MSRFVELTPRLPPKPVATGEGEELESPQSKTLQRIAKYVPSEIIGGYMVLTGLIQAIPIVQFRIAGAWLAFAVGLTMTPIYLLRVQRPKREQRPQVWIATFAFIPWAYALGGPFAMPPIDHYYSTALGVFVAGLFSWVVGLLYEPKEKEPTH